jgi:nicotinamide-nucleotide amidase
MPRTPSERRILTAELLSIGSELVVGDTRDTNAGELARSLTDAGVTVGRMTALPDRLDIVADAFAAALERADLVVSTGGLGPTPDDLTREAISRVLGETPVVDPDLELWLRELWARRDIPFPELNLKQAWRIPSSEALPNPNGTAPGWFVSRADGRIAIALPGPPREMRPMWADHALPRLRSRGLGTDVAVRTYRLTGIGESQVADILGEELLRRTNPEVAT